MRIVLGMLKESGMKAVAVIAVLFDKRETKRGETSCLKEQSTC